jgi:hypothetical protein
MNASGKANESTEMSAPMPVCAEEDKTRHSSLFDEAQDALVPMPRSDIPTPACR